MVRIGLLSSGLPGPIGISRGFMASGNSRTNSIWSMPSSQEACFTSTKSARPKRRSKSRAMLRCRYCVLPSWFCRPVTIRVFLLHRDLELLRLEVRHDERGPVAVFAGPQDVVGRVIILGRIGQARVHQVQDAIEADAGPPQEIEVEVHA